MCTLGMQFCSAYIQANSIKVDDEVEAQTTETFKQMCTGIFDNPKVTRRRPYLSFPAPKQKYWREIPNKNNEDEEA